MLVVDPMKRITITELREHHWFKSQLPRYLAVPAPDAKEHLKKVCFFLFFLFFKSSNFSFICQLDEDIINKVINMGFERNQLIQSLQSRVQDDVYISFRLL